MPSNKKVGDIFWNDTIMSTPFRVETEKWSRYFKAETECNICGFKTIKPLNIYRWCSMCRQFWRKIIKEWSICKLELTWWEYAIVDADDIDRVRMHTWYRSRRWAVESRMWKRLVKLHRFIMNPPDNVVIDHIDRNPLNNSKSNLRECSQMENCHNSSWKNTSKTWVKWVWMNRNWKYVSQICVGWKREHIGTFSSIEDAQKAYIEKSLEYHWKFSIMASWIESQ